MHQEKSIASFLYNEIGFLKNNFFYLTFILIVTKLVYILIQLVVCITKS